MESDAFFPPYAVAEHGLQHRKTPTVGWVERSETHRPPAISRTMGFAALYPSYESWLANDPEVRRFLRGRILRAVVNVPVDGGCLRFEIVISSCRERVCLYVSISDFAVYLRKKNQ